MKNTNILSKTILALAGVVLSAGSAKALTYNNGDLLLSFRATGGTGASTNYVIDLGAAANFLTTASGVTSNGIYATGSIVNISSANSALTGLGADLTSLYGANWNTRADLDWSVLGVYQGTPRPTGLANNITLATSAEGVNGSAPSGTSSPQLGLAASAQGGLATNQAGFASAYGGSSNNGATATAGQEQVNPSFTNSYADYIAASTVYGTNSNPSVENNFGSGTSASVNDLYLMKTTTGNGNPALLQGGFQITSTGGVLFSSDTSQFVTPVPEPASAGLITAGLLGFVALVKRRRIAGPCKA